MELAILLITVFVLLVIGSPVTVALGVGSLFFILMEGTPSVVVLHRMVSGIDSFPLIAVPFFILAGHLMNSAGITTRIFGFAKALVGWMHGGLGHVNIGASIIFAGMSGAAVADAGGLGTIEIKAMRDAGYDDDFSVGITAASSTIGSIIPPSLPLVIYGVMASASIGELFAAGFIPGLLMRVSLMIMDTIETSAAILMIVASATIFAWILIDQQVAVMLGDALLGFSQNTINSHAGPK